MLRLGRGHSLRESGLFSFENLSTELVLAALGVLVALRLDDQPGPDSRSPSLRCSSIHRSLAVPRLEQEARLDPKTGLFNVRHFSAVLNDKLEQSLRTGQPLALLMIDLDLLREINNTYGHLAGDAILGAHRRRLPQQPPGGRHRGALRRRGVRAAPAGHRPRGRARAGRADPRDDRPAAGHRGGDRRDAVGDGVDRHRHVPARRHAIRARSSTAPTSPCTAPRSRGATASSTAASSRSASSLPNSEWWGPKPSARPRFGASQPRRQPRPVAGSRGARSSAFPVSVRTRGPRHRACRSRSPASC